MNKETEKPIISPEEKKKLLADKTKQIKEQQIIQK